jgi:NADPH-ferrihemoprotein reductase
VLFLEESNKKNPFPCPTTYRTALLHYVDITSKAKGNLLQGLIEYAKDTKDKEFLEKLTKNNDDGKVLIGSFFVSDSLTSLPDLFFIHLETSSRMGC